MKSLDDVVADLAPVHDRLSDYSTPHRVSCAGLDEGQRLMLAQAWRAVDQVLSEIVEGAAVAIDACEAASFESEGAA